MSYGINYKITLQFYGSGYSLPTHGTIEGERYGFKTRAAAKAYVTRWIVNPRKPDGRHDERIYIWEEK